MRRNPLVLLSVVVSIYAYILIRQAGHLVAMALAGVQPVLLTRYGVVPFVEIGPESTAVGDSTRGLIIIAGPAMALLAGYAVFALVNRHRGIVQSPAGPVLGAFCYIALIVDPIYYSVIPLAGLGGEPEKLARLLRISTGAIAGGAFAVLVLNIILARLRIVPLLKDRQARSTKQPRLPDTAES